MQQNFNAEEKDALSQIIYLVGDGLQIMNMPNLSSRIPFDEDVVSFLSVLSKELMQSTEAKAYPDVVTFGFWIRAASLLQLEEKFGFHDNLIHLGNGTVFHIAPSNVPVNFAYSLVVGLLMGNANIVRIPSRDFPQVNIIVRAIKKVLSEHEVIKPYISLIRYGRERQINDVLSAMADVRVIWGGDATIKEIRKSPLSPRSTEITFADRFSIAVIDSDVYLQSGDKERIALNFYNDTYLSDQNACTSPRLVVWIGSRKEEAKFKFWELLHELVRDKYNFQSIMSVNKLTSAYLMAAHEQGTEIIPSEDNLLVRVRVPKANKNIIDFRDNSGYFFEYDCDDLRDLWELCNEKRIQTIGLLGDSAMLRPLILSGVKGIDRIVPIGKTMNFDFLWDGYNLAERLTRTVTNYR
ncbi:MAG: hypothetical protein NC251_02565 [Lachnoclostridium sp.]|nr:hypothetical protein [Lachnospira sp.]MCM1247294.1 hypothetical protein [Lachnoclostridium sp.]MCM1534404.1 hypothetical protein [Clostridium sp.]